MSWATSEPCGGPTRVKLVFGGGLGRCGGARQISSGRCLWSPPANLATVADLSSAIVRAFGLQKATGNGVLLSVDGFTVPANSPISILSSTDVITITPVPEEADWSIPIPEVVCSPGEEAEEAEEDKATQHVPKNPKSSLQTKEPEIKEIPVEKPNLKGKSAVSVPVEKKEEPSRKRQPSRPIVQETVAEEMLEVDSKASPTESPHEHAPASKKIRVSHIQVPPQQPEAAKKPNQKPKQPEPEKNVLKKSSTKAIITPSIKPTTTSPALPIKPSPPTDSPSTTAPIISKSELRHVSAAQFGKKIKFGDDGEIESQEQIQPAFIVQGKKGRKGRRIAQEPSTEKKEVTEAPANRVLDSSSVTGGTDDIQTNKSFIIRQGDTLPDIASQLGKTNKRKQLQQPQPPAPTPAPAQEKNEERVEEPEEDYNSVPPFTGPPMVGDVIAFKMAELSLATWSPEISGWKVAEITSYESTTGVLSLNLLKSKSSSTTWSGEQEGALTLHQHNLIDLRLCSRPNKEPTATSTSTPAPTQSSQLTTATSTTSNLSNTSSSPAPTTDTNTATPSSTGSSTTKSSIEQFTSTTTTSSSSSKPTSAQQPHRRYTGHGVGSLLHRLRRSAQEQPESEQGTNTHANDSGDSCASVASTTPQLQQQQAEPAKNE
ncbi:hypothetical protein Pelo_3730 [Pelomyxa schiedti]|nr:hypothetical protein Pelo_3730 [Pelomyxa schiedti]